MHAEIGFDLHAESGNQKSLCPSGILCVKQRKLCLGVFTFIFFFFFFFFCILSPEKMYFQASRYNLLNPEIILNKTVHAVTCVSGCLHSEV